MHVETMVRQGGLVGGTRTDLPKGVVADERESRLGRGRGRDNLYVLVEVAGQKSGREFVADQLADIIRDVYYGQRGSVTAGLQEALREANSLLFEENKNSLPGQKWVAGATCAVLRDADLFVAQAGPAAQFVIQSDSAVRLPDVSPWLDDVSFDERDVAALGERRDVPISLFHRPLADGDLFFLVNADLARRIRVEQWSETRARASVNDVFDALLGAGGGQNCSVLVVGLGVAESPTQDLPAALDVVQDATETLRSAWSPAKVTESLARLHLGERLRAAGRAVLTALGAVVAFLLSLLRRLVPGQSTAETKTPTERSPRRPKVPRTPREQPRVQNPVLQRVLLGVAIVIPFIVALVVGTTVIRRGSAYKAEVDGLWQQANLLWQDALASTDPVVVRGRLAEAEIVLDQLLDLKPDHAEALDLRQQVAVQMDETNKVWRVTWVGKLYSYPQDAELTRVVVEGSHIFVLDRANNTVYHHQLDDQQQALRADEGDAVLVQKGDQIGGLLVADLVDMVWMPVGSGRQKSGLFVLESGGGLVDYDPTTDELLSLSVAASDTWQFPRLVGSYYGRFYVLDSSANKIWRYGPTADGYSGAPDEWLQSDVSLVGVKDMAIGDSIYLLYADGRIRKLTAGSPDTFDISDWDMPPQNPSSMFTRPPEDAKWLYVGDRGNHRIVQCTKEGKFQRQFRLAPDITENGNVLAEMSSLFVDEIGGRAYVLSNQDLYLLVLPD